MSFEALNAVLAHSKATGSTRLVLMYLAHRANAERKHASWPSVATIAKETLLSERQVKRILREAENQLKELQISYQTGRSQTNVYTLLLPGLNGIPEPSKKDVMDDTPAATSRSDNEGKKRVTPEVPRGDVSDTQTQKEAEKKNSKIPPNPPEGDGGEDLLNHWIKGIASIFNQDASEIDHRLKRQLRKVLPSTTREDLELLKSFYSPERPEHSNTEEERLLRRRKISAKNLVHELPEQIELAREHERATEPAWIPYRRKRVEPADFPWEAVSILELGTACFGICDWEHLPESDHVEIRAKWLALSAERQDELANASEEMLREASDRNGEEGIAYFKALMADLAASSRGSEDASQQKKEGAGAPGDARQTLRFGVAKDDVPP